jgi:hypothetical protein
MKSDWRLFLLDRGLRPLLLVAALALGALALLLDQGLGLAGLHAERDAKAEALAQLDPARGATGGRAAPLEWSADSAGLAASALESHLRGLLSENAANVIETEVLTRPAEAEDKRGLGLRAVFEASNAAVQAILFALETGRPGASVEELRLERARAGDSADPPLRVTLLLSARWSRP